MDDDTTIDDGPGEPTSLRHVAQAAGVSVATASRVLSGSDHPVSSATRERVLAAADRLSFEPNRLARALVTARSETIGVIVHDIADPYFAEIVRGLEDGLHDDDYRLLVASSDRDPHEEVKYVRAFHAHQVDAVVFAASSLTDPTYEHDLRTVAARYRNAGGVIVTLSDHILPCPAIRFDNHAAIAQMIDYLTARGHRRIAYLSGPSELSVTAARLEGYQSALNHHGIAFDERIVEKGPFTIAGGITAIRTLLDRTPGSPPDFTAVLAANDLLAIGAMTELIDSGLDIPGAMSIVGIDDIPIAAFGRVPLTTFRLPTYQLGRMGAAAVLEMLAGREPAESVVEGSIVERGSVAVAPGQAPRDVTP